LESIPIGLLVIDSKGEIITTNRSASEILGYTTGMLEGKGWGEIFFDTDKNDEFNQVIIDTIKEKKVNLHHDTDYTAPTGEILRLSITTSFLYDNDEIAAIVALIDDVTELHRMHEREKTILEEKSRIQKERAESLVKLASGVAHQIRNPVTSIGGFAMRMLKKTDDNHSNAPYLNNILKGTSRLEHIVQAVSEYMDSSPVKEEKILIQDVLNEARCRLDKKAAQLSKKITWNIRSRPTAVFADPILFPKTLDEILTNSLESFKDEQGSIDIVVLKNRTELSIEISDTGTGISGEDRPYIFDPFFSTKAVGVGMGLCKARKIIVDHKGELVVESGPERGAKVTIRLPFQGNEN